MRVPKVQVQQLEQQSTRQVEAIRQLQASARDQGTAMARQGEWLARTDGELARVRLANHKLKGEYLEQTALLSGHALTLVPPGHNTEDVHASAVASGDLNVVDGEHFRAGAPSGRREDRVDLRQLQYLTSTVLLVSVWPFWMQLRSWGQ